MIDVAIAMDHLIMVAANLGLGNCRMAAFNMDATEPIIFTPLRPATKNPFTLINNSIGRPCVRCSLSPKT